MYCIEGPCEATWFLHWDVVNITVRDWGKKKAKVALVELDNRLDGIIDDLKADLRKAQ
jgi:hypothetical protein